MSIFIEDSNTNLLREHGYTFTKDRLFAIKPVTVGDEDDELEDQTYSNKLFIRQDYTIDENSPLSKLISVGIIVKEPNTKHISNVKTKRKHNGSTKRKTIKTPVDNQNTAYDVYTFYRPLIDNRTYDEDRNPDYDDDVAINENDCLKAAECLTIATQTHDRTLFEKLLKASQSPPVLRTAVTEKTFAETTDDKDNIKLLKDIGLSKKNNYAIPEMGESYVIVRKKINENTAYHASFVVYTHDGVNITLEAEADAGPTYQPKFSFYDTNPEGNTFHRRWSAELYKKSEDENHQIRYQALYNNGETIVLKSRVLSDILKDLEDEQLKKERLTLTNKKTKRSSSLTKTKRSSSPTKTSRDLKTRNTRSPKPNVDGTNRTKKLRIF